MRDVFHDAVQGPAEELGILIIHGNDDEQLGLTRWIKRVLPKAKARCGKPVRVSRYSGISGLISEIAEKIS
jgi:hypothetical protein